jgi:uncharacterized protein (TIGR02117 family)
VVAAPLSRLNRAAKALGRVLLGAALAVALFLLAAWIGSAIPRNGDPAPVTDGVQIMVETNGVHTGIVMPVTTADFDWRSVFPGSAAPVHGEPPTHIAVGWGEREVFLNTPTWGDLKASTALRILFAGGEPIMRVSHYVRPAPGPNYRPVTISRDDYLHMARAIAASLAPEGERPRVAMRGVDPGDAYYLALGHYTLANTCNTWVGDRLADGGMQMGLWTPFAGGVMQWIEPPA